MPLPSALDECTCYGSLTINGISMHTPAWNVVDLLNLWSPPALRGENVTVGGTPGQVAYPFEVEQTDFILPMVISGRFDKDGNENPNGVFACFLSNLAELRASVFGPSDGTSATWAATITTDWADIYTARVQVLAITPAEHIGPITKATLDLRVPAGEFILSP